MGVCAGGGCGMARRAECIRTAMFPLWHEKRGSEGASGRASLSERASLPGDVCTFSFCEEWDIVCWTCLLRRLGVRVP